MVMPYGQIPPAQLLMASHSCTPRSLPPPLEKAKLSSAIMAGMTALLQESARLSQKFAANRATNAAKLMKFIIDEPRPDTN